MSEENVNLEGIENNQDQDKNPINNDKILSIEEKIKRLRLLQKKEIAKIKGQNRKLANKQKIIIGGYMLNKFKTMSTDEISDFVSDILSTIPESKKSDIDAIKKLLTKI
ncbi:hypothetical protein [Francisella philomiragia]|uniref:hypothetical protein n=1 Tax=Francisella philomiragia TaxID=28110 RepID=UPI001B8AECE3|nr:hypothetical protein [Francisella philomiragia]QUE32412.1 hypothetical protein IMS64_09735 [Francisella philomiragia]